jgi:hypothetical protein
MFRYGGELNGLYTFVDHTGLEPVTSPMPWVRSTR